MLEEVEGVVDLHDSLGDELDRARILARALADRPDAPAEVATLAGELDRLEPSGGSGRAVVARELSELAVALAPALADSAPAIADAPVKAAEPLQTLDKAKWSGTYVNDLPDSAFLYVEAGGEILESYLAPAEFEVDGTRIKRGTWLLAVRVTDDDLWRQIKSGELTGFSIGGRALRRPA